MTTDTPDPEVPADRYGRGKQTLPGAVVGFFLGTALGLLIPSIGVGIGMSFGLLLGMVFAGPIAKAIRWLRDRGN